MTPNEFRIGNYINYHVRNVLVPTQFDRISKDEDMSRISPIPITVDVLEAAGFEEDTDEFEGFLVLSLDEHMEIRFDTKNLFYMAVAKKRYIVHSYTWRHIKYLHQLQNFYFSWTNEELNVELISGIIEP